MTDLKNYLEKFPGRKVLMTVYPHPDDETMAAGGVLLLAKRLGWKTIVICLTKGGAGKMLINPQGKSTKEVREKELALATKRLGVGELILGDYQDGQLKETVQEWKPWVTEMIQKYQPGIIVTYDRSGMTGHPDHISLSIALSEILGKLKKTPRLFWTSMPHELRNRMVPESLWEYVSVPNFELAMGRDVFRKWRAVKAHRSQPLFTHLLAIPLLLLFLKYPREWYYEVDLKRSYPHKFIEFKI
jgi:LmbE family N-acetylglucosaminyl deacetylase